MATIPPQEIAKPGGSLETQTAAFKAIGELTDKFVLMLAALDGDSGVNLTTYAATYTPTNRIGSS